MKYETYRVKAEGCPYYFKVATSERETEIYLVRSDDKGDVLGSLKIHEGEPADRDDVMFMVNVWKSIFAKCSFNKIESDVPSTNEVPVSTKIVVGAKLTERKVICAKKRRANTTKRKAKNER